MNDHNLTKADAELLMGIVSLPLELRIDALQKLVLNDRGRYGLLLMFANFIGLSNGVVQATEAAVAREGFLRAMIDRKDGQKGNLPTIFGALMGVTVAAPEECAACSDCAFRLGTPPNYSADSVIQAKACIDYPEEEGEFLCHVRLDSSGNNKPCIGAQWMTGGRQ